MAEVKKKRAKLEQNLPKIFRPQFWQHFLHRTPTRDWVLVIIIFIVLIAVLSLDYVPQQLDVTAGQPSKYDYVAPRTILDNQRMERLFQEKEQQVYLEAIRDPENLIKDSNKIRQALQQANYFFERMNNMRRDLSMRLEDGRPISPTLWQEYVQNFIDQINQEYNLGFDSKTISYCLKLGPQEWDRFQSGIKQELYDIINNKLIREENIKDIRNEISAWIDEEKFSANEIETAKNIISRLIRPNVTPDMDKIQKLQEEKKRGIEPVYIPAGTPILIKDRIVTENDIKILKDLNVIRNGSNRILIFISLSILVLSFIAVLLVYIVQYKKKVLSDERLLVLITVIVGMLLIIAKIVTMLPVSYNSWDWRFLIPVAFASMLLTIFIDAHLAIFLTVLLSFLIGVICKGEIIFSIVSLMGGMVGIFSLNRFSQRGDLMRAGALVMVTNVITIFTLELLLKGTDLLLAVKNSILGGVGGFTASVLTIGLLPFVEHLFGVTSSMRLLELANPTHPLLRRLLLEAPGTYHHSIIVGNLAETAANAIGADGLLARVGSYYHDIGKIKRPYFFNENQMGMDNPHEKITPTLSALIITSHVRDGVEMLRENKLPENIIEIVEQHHGTDLIRYFYARAAETEKDDRSQIKPEDFRYPGPVPRSKEAALVMMADSIEAAVKAMPKPTIAKIESIVNKMIKERLDDAQFNECELTLKDLNLASQAFQKILNGIYHTRVQYPDISEIERKKTNNDSRK